MTDYLINTSSPADSSIGMNVAMNKNRFLGNDLPLTGYEESNVIIIPAPLEKTVSYGKGTSNGPDEILKASAYVELFDEELHREIFQTGIFTHQGIANSLSLDRFLSELESLVMSVLRDRKFPIILGGEHALTIAPVRALKNVITVPFSVLQLDAHADLRDTYENSPFSHACIMRRIFDLKVPAVPVGIRSLSKEEADFIERNDLPIFYAQNIVVQEEWMALALQQLHQHVYITLDIDVFDPSIISHTGTPEPGGMTWYQLLNFFKQMKQMGKQIIGMDVVEYAPRRDHDAQSFTVAKLITKMIGYFVA